MICEKCEERLEFIRILNKTRHDTPVPTGGFFKEIPYDEWIKELENEIDECGCKKSEEPHILPQSHIFLHLM